MYSISKFVELWFCMYTLGHGVLINKFPDFLSTFWMAGRMKYKMIQKPGENLQNNANILEKILFILSQYIYDIFFTQCFWEIFIINGGEHLWNKTYMHAMALTINGVHTPV